MTGILIRLINRIEEQLEMFQVQLSDRSESVDDESSTNKSIPSFFPSVGTFICMMFFSPEMFWLTILRSKWFALSISLMSVDWGG